MAEERIGITQLQILWVLRKGWKSGKDVIKELSSMRKSKVRHPNIYTALRKMEGQGFVQSSKEGRVVRWKLTQKGKKNLNKYAYLLLESIDSMIEELKCSRCERICK